MFQLNEGSFFERYSAVYKLQPGPAAGLGEILGVLAADPELTNIRYAAYMLATVKHECADIWHPIEEFGKGKGRPYGVPVTVTDDRSGKQYTNTYYGRGYVQLTWQKNYQRLGNVLGLGDDLLFHPEKALSHPVSHIASCHMGCGKALSPGAS